MKLLNQLTLKNLKLNFRRSIMSILGIMLSVALIFTVISMAASLKESVANVYKQNFGSHYVKTIDGDKYINTISNHKNVKDYSLIKTLGYAKIGSLNQFKPYLRVMALDKEGFAFNNLDLIEGRYPENNKELVISESLKSNGGLRYKVGDKLTLDLGNRILDQDNSESIIEESYVKRNILPPYYMDGEELTDTQPKEYEIVGIVKRPNNSIEEYSNPAFSAFTLVGDNDRYFYSEAYFTTKRPSQVNDTIMDIFGDLTLAEINNGYLKIQGVGLGDGFMQMIYGLIGILMAIILVTSVMIIKNSFSISIVERTKQFGILKSLGATDKQVKSNILFEGFILGLIGIVLGLALGYTASRILILVTNQLLDQAIEGIHFKLTLPIWAIFASVVISLITIFLSTNSIAKRSIKFTPIEAIRSSHDIKVDKKDIKTPRLIEKTFDIGGLIAYRNLKRNKKKYRVTIVSLAISVAVFIGMYYFVDGMVRATRASYTFTNFDLSLSNYNSDIDLINELRSLGQASLKDDEYAIYKRGSAEFYKEDLANDLVKLAQDRGFGLDNIAMNGTVKVIDRETFQKLLNENNLPQDTQGLVINQGRLKDENDKVTVFKLFKNLNIKVDIFYEGYDKKETYDLKIGEISKLAPGMNEYSQDPSLLVFVSEDLGLKMYSLGNEMYINTEDPDQTSKDIEAYLDTNNTNQFDLYSPSADQKVINNIILLVQIFGYGFIIVISLIGLTNVFNTITSNIYSRKREFGSLISFGMTQGQLNRMTLFEALMIGTRSLLWGIAFGLLITRGIAYFMGYNFNIAYRFPLLAIIISILTVFILTFIIMYYSLSRIKSFNVIETIRNENI